MSLVEVVCHGCRGEFTVHLASVGNCPRCSSDDLDLPPALIEAQLGTVGVRKQAETIELRTAIQAWPEHYGEWSPGVPTYTLHAGERVEVVGDYNERAVKVRSSGGLVGLVRRDRIAVSTDLVDDSADDTCSTCGGTGEVGGTRCHTCSGSGKTTTAKRRTAKRATLPPLAKRTAAILADIAADNPHLSRAQRIKLAAEAIRRTGSSARRSSGGVRRRSALTIHEVSSSDVQNLGYGEDADLEVRGLSGRAEEVALSVYESFDEASCSSCGGFIGWGMGYEDPETGRSQGAYTPFWVVDDGQRAWPVCEDCMVGYE